MEFWRAKGLISLWRLALPLVLLAGASLYPPLALAKTNTPTLTQTSTPTVTFTPTPTDSLDVFKSPTPDLQSYYITSPLTGEQVLGEVTITGKSLVKDFVSYELAFSYPDNPPNTWFLISKGETPVVDGTLGAWQTGAISDGSYILRLRVIVTGGDVLDALVENVRVANYSATETPRPSATPLPEFTAAPTATVTPTRTPNPTPTSLPENPASLSSNTILSSIGRGALAVIIIFAVFGAVLSIRKK